MFTVLCWHAQCYEYNHVY